MRIRRRLGWVDSFRSVCPRRCDEGRPTAWRGKPGRPCTGSCADASRAMSEPRNDQAQARPWRARSTPRQPSAGPRQPPAPPRWRLAARRRDSRPSRRWRSACALPGPSVRSLALMSMGVGYEPSRRDAALWRPQPAAWQAQSAGAISLTSSSAEVSSNGRAPPRRRKWVLRTART